MEKIPPTFKILWFFLKSQKKLSVGVLVTSLAFAAFEGINVAVFLPIIGTALSDSVPAGNYGRIIHFINWIVLLIPLKNPFFSAIAFLVLATWCKSIFFLLYTYASSKLSQASRREIQEKTYSKFIFSDYQFFLDYKQGTLLYRLLTAPVNVGTTLKLIPDIFIHSIKIFVFLIILFSMSSKSGRILGHP